MNEDETASFSIGESSSKTFESQSVSITKNFIPPNNTINITMNYVDDGSISITGGDSANLGELQVATFQKHRHKQGGVPGNHSSTLYPWGNWDHLEVTLNPVMAEKVLKN